MYDHQPDKVADPVSCIPGFFRRGGYWEMERAEPTTEEETLDQNTSHLIRTNEKKPSNGFGGFN